VGILAAQRIFGRLRGAAVQTGARTEPSATRTARLRSTLYGAQCSCLIRDRLSRPKKAVGRQDRESEADHSIGVGSRALFPFSLLNMESRSIVCAVRQRNWPTAVPLHVALSSSFCLVGTQQLESAECSSFHAACMAELR